MGVVTMSNSKYLRKDKQKESNGLPIQTIVDVKVYDLTVPPKEKIECTINEYMDHRILYKRLREQDELTKHEDFILRVLELMYSVPREEYATISKCANIVNVNIYCNLIEEGE